jgi:ZIP family zinc transporter
MAVLVSLVSMVSTVVGGLVAAHVGDRRHLVLGLAAGLVLGVV